MDENMNRSIRAVNAFLSALTDILLTVLNFLHACPIVNIDCGHVRAICAYVYGRVPPDSEHCRTAVLQLSSLQDEFEASTNFNRALSPG
ncbi:hypothetical protein P692DRAFT_20832950 [Suillus brevipes Sb2]|nr:hypothetical protein P692DRAFT_20832950 [Suillus brevipes Sb2]